MKHPPSWQEFCQRYWHNETMQIGLDWSRMNVPNSFLEQMKTPFHSAFLEMGELERGAIANPDEQRQVGHYWLRNAQLAPSDQQTRAIQACHEQVTTFAQDIHTGKIAPTHASHFRQFVLVGIGGSALGPQLVSDALRTPNDPLQAYFVDNTDPDGIDRLLGDLGSLKETLTLVISKSGGTQETRNGMLEMQAAYQHQQLDFAKHTAVVTGVGSPLAQKAEQLGMLANFPMWDWVGGRTSLFSAVGMLPAALQGIDIQAMLQGARLMDESTRVSELSDNPAAILAACWYHAGNGRGERNMVVLPYKDRLLLLSRYLQQLVMESLGKALDRQGRPVHQGLTVYGNKGSTDQHAYIQQLRDGADDFFVNFIEVQRERTSPLLEVEPNVTSGDYLLGFLYGTRQALWQEGHPSITLQLREFSPQSLGSLLALYERAVGFYASLIDINAYHQPGVEAGKLAATAFIALQRNILTHFQQHTAPTDIPTLAEKLGIPEQTEAIFYIVEHLAANGRLIHDRAPVTQRNYRPVLS